MENHQAASPLPKRSKTTKAEEHPLKKDVFDTTEDPCSLTKDDEDEENEFLGTPVEIAASIFRTQHSFLGNDDDSYMYNPPASLNLSSEASIGGLVDNLYSQYHASAEQNDSDAMEPLPLKFWQAQGAPIGIDNTEEESMLLPAFQDPWVSQSSSLAPSFDLQASEDSNSSNEKQHDPATIMTVSTKAKAAPQKADPLSSPDVPALQFLPPRAKPSSAKTSSQCISPDPTMTTMATTKLVAAGASGAKRKLNVSETAGSTNCTDTQAEKKLKVVSDTVDLESPQMTPILQLLKYLKQNQQEEACAFQQLEKIIKDCQKKHQKGTRRSRNLPGSIFERAVKEFGATEFQRLYSASQKQGTIDVKEQREPANISESNQQPNVAKPASSRETHKHVGMRAPPPTLVEVAVGYGFHLARTHFLHDNNTNLSTREVLAQGVDTVSRMNELERLRFWKYMIESPLYERTQHGAA